MNTWCVSWDLAGPSWDLGIRPTRVPVLSAMFTSCVSWDPYFTSLRASFCFFKMEVRAPLQVWFCTNKTLLWSARCPSTLSIDGSYNNLFHFALDCRTTLTSLIQLKKWFLISSAQIKLKPECSDSVLRQWLTWLGKPPMGSSFISCTGNFWLI